jgi:predicted RNA binding protein YcfA (HicA-like mRNA interferase family)
LSKLPVVSGRQAVAALRKAGYEIDHQTGSDIILRHTQAPFRRPVVPNHPEVAKGTLRALVRQAGMTVEDFIALL